MKKFTATPLSTGVTCGAAASGLPRRLALIVGAAVLSLFAGLLTTIPGLSAVPAKAAVTSDRQVAIDAAGDRLITVSTSGQVENYWKKADGFWYGPDAIGGTARSDSPVAIDSSGQDVVFIDGSGDVVKDSRNSDGTWSGPAAIGGTARAGSPLAMSGDGSHVVFVNTSGAVVNDWTSNGTWAGPKGIGGTARSDSPIAINENATHVYFIDTSGNVVNDWVSNGAWAGPAGIGGTARTGSSMATSDSGNIVAFINGSGAVVNDYVSNGAWAGPKGMGGTARSDSPLALDGAPDHVYFVDTSGNVVNDYVSNGAWAGPDGIGGTAVAGSGIASVDSGGGTVAFFNGNNPALDWHEAGYWDGPGYPDTISANIRGGNWPDDDSASTNPLGNYGPGPLVIGGLSTSDTPAQAEADAATIAGNFYAASGANTVRIPINEGTVSSSYWPVYVAAIQGMLTKGNVIITYWGQKGSNGKPANMTDYWAMWQTVVNQFAGNEDVLFEPVNEPDAWGTDASSLDSDIYSPWLSKFSNVARARVLLDGIQFANNVTQIGGLESGTRLSIHDYTWFEPGQEKDEAGWDSDLQGKIGSYAARTVLTEYGNNLGTGLNFDNPPASGESVGDTNETNYIRGMTDAARELGIGSLMWIGIGVTSNYSMYLLNGTSVAPQNTSAVDRAQYGWGL